MSIALNVITGFLGSGKTTLLKRLLQGESLGDTADRKSTRLNSSHWE